MVKYIKTEKDSLLRDFSSKAIINLDENERENVRTRNKQKALINNLAISVEEIKRDIEDIKIYVGLR